MHHPDFVFLQENWKIVFMTIWRCLK
jgi:hypothetical protein